MSINIYQIAVQQMRDEIGFSHLMNLTPGEVNPHGLARVRLGLPGSGRDHALRLDGHIAPAFIF